MTRTAIFTDDVTRQLNDLPATERAAVTSALVSEFVDGTPCRDRLTGFQRLIYVMLSDMLRRGTFRHSAAAV